MVLLFPVRPDDLHALVRAALDAAGPQRSSAVSLATGAPRTAVQVPDSVARQMSAAAPVPFDSTPPPAPVSETAVPPPARPYPEPAAPTKRAAKKTASSSRRTRRRTKE